jgi:hypothetical protein
MPGSSILFYWSSCLLLCQTYAAFIAMLSPLFHPWLGDNNKDEEGEEDEEEWE